MGIAFIRLRTWLSSISPEPDDDTGASLVEYALLLVLIAMVAIIALAFLGEAASEGLNEGGAGFAAN